MATNELVLRAEESFERPPAGLHNAVCVAVEDLGQIEVEWNGERKLQHKIHLYWQIEERNSRGERFSLRKRYTMSSHEASTLRKDLEQWRARPFTYEELKGGFPLQRLIGVPCVLQVTHQEGGNGKTYANVTGVLPHDARVGERLSPEPFELPKPRAEATTGARPTQGRTATAATTAAEPEIVPF